MSVWPLVFDAVIAVLLVATISYAMVLNRKLTALRSAKDELAKLLQSFSQVTARADAGLEAIRHAAANSAKDLNGQVAVAEGLCEDLRFLIQRAGLSADKVEAVISNDRADRMGQATSDRARHKPASALAGAKSPGPTKTAPKAIFKSVSETRVQPRKTDGDKQVSAEQVALIKALDGVR